MANSQSEPDEGWTAWDRFEWSSRLIEFYFGRESGRLGPVEFLDVSEEALAAATGSISVRPEDVRQQFLQVISSSATNESPWRKAELATPDRWFAYLAAACSVFVDSDRATEARYLEPLRSELGEKFTLDLELMPQLWHRLRDWLEEQPDQYRPLVLPDPGGLRRIGYAKKLAFPSRSDQRTLGAALAEARDSAAPTIAQALSAARACRTHLSAQLQESLAAFEAHLDGGSSPEILYETMFWSAVLSALRASVSADSATIGEYGLLIYAEEGIASDVDLVASSTATTDADWKEIDEYGGVWTQLCILTDPFEALSRLDRSLLKRWYQDGQIPLIDSEEWRTPRPAELDQIDAYLLAPHRLAALDPQPAVAVSLGNGWSIVAVDRLPGETNARPRPRQIHLRGGVRLGQNTYLNDPLARPLVNARWADRVELRAPNGDSRSLTRQGDAWKLAADKQTDGEYTIVARADEGAQRRSIHLVGAPGTSEPKQPSDSSRLGVEGAATLNVFAPRSLEASVEMIDSNQTVLLGRDVGTGARSLAEATWIVTKTGESETIRLLPGRDPTPRFRAGTKGDRRRWKEYLSKSTAADESTRRAAASAHHAARSITVANSLDSPEVKVFEGQPTTPRHGAERLEAVLVGLSRSRALIPVADVIDRIASLVPHRSVEDLPWRRLRDLAEAGVVEIATDLRWRGRSVVGVRPQLVAHATPSGATAVVSGLTTQLMRTETRARAEALGLQCSTRTAVSDLTPSTLVVFASGLAELQQLAHSTRLPLRFLPETPRAARTLADLLPYEPEGYERWGPTFHFDGLDSAEVSILRRPDAPGWYRVRIDGAVVSARTRESAKFWAAIGLGRLDLTAEDTLVTSNVALPLSVAWWTAHLGASRPGYDEVSHLHHYPTPNTHCASVVIRHVHQLVSELDPWT